MNVQRERRRNLVLLAADAYREADAWCRACLEEWEQEEAYTPYQFKYVSDWWTWSIEADGLANLALLEAAREA